MNKLPSISVQFTAFTVMTIFLAFSSCKRTAEKTAESTVETAIEKSTGEKFEIDREEEKVSVRTAQEKVTYGATDNSWPKDMPKEVPVLQGGAISSTAVSQAFEGDTWSVYYEGLTVKMLEDYETALRNAGFKTALFRLDEGGSVSGEKDKLTVSCFIAGDNGALTVFRRKN